MKLRILSGVVLRASLLMVACAAFAQDQEDRRAMEEVVVTGSLIRGTPEDAALPVEVFTAADLKDVGGPTALEFVKDLTVSGPTTGASHYFSGAQLNNDVGVNLRGLGADKTLTLFNGRRLGGNTTAAVAGGSANVAMLPGIAFSRIEILKDGAAVTYGADATGGVVNYITYDSYVGTEIDVSYKNYGADGDWRLAALHGFGEGDTNVIVAAEWDHRSELDAKERDFTSLPYGVNPAPWSILTNLASYLARSPFGPVNSGDDLVWGGVLGVANDFTQDSCEAVGGVYLVTTFTQCKYNYVPFYNLVEETDTYRLFFQVNSAVSDTMDFHLQMSWARVHTPYAMGSPAQPVIRGPAELEGAAYQFFVPSTNPNVGEFVQRTGFDQNQYWQAGIINGFTPITYRAFAHGGNPAFSVNGNYGMPTEVDNRYFHLATGLNGVLENDIGYDFAVTYNHQTEFGNWPDVVGYRLQEALNGFGGANCNAADTDPNSFGTQNSAAAGTNGCQWWNPFASSFSRQPILGLPNPSYQSGSENPSDLARWIFNPRSGQNILWNATVDLVFDGRTPIDLPGGTIAWAAGTQWRTTKLRESVPDPLFNGRTPCMWPGQDPANPTDPAFTGCTPDEPGPFVFFGTDIPESLAQDQLSYFLELNLPIHDRFYMTAAARYEEFTPGDLDTTVYKVSFKLDATDNLSFRGSYGTNYQAPGLGITPGEVTNGVNSYTIAAGNWRGAQTITQSGIEPETATVWNVGGIWQSRGFADDHDFRFMLDYWDIETEDELGLLASANDVADAVFSISPDGPGGDIPLDGSALADCSHPLVNRVTFNGTCTQGVTTAADFSNVTTDYGNGPGQMTSGFDISMNYSFPALDGELSFGLTATMIDEFEETPTILDGVTLDPGDDRLGNLNFATIAFAASEWRAKLHANYAWGLHNFRAVLTFISGVDDDRYFNADGSLNVAALVPEGFKPGTTQSFDPSYYGVRADDWITLDFHYNVDLAFGTVSASIVNVTDEDPPESRQELGYDPRIGNALGRQFEIGFRKEF